MTTNRISLFQLLVLFQPQHLPQSIERRNMNLKLQLFILMGSLICFTQETEMGDFPVSPMMSRWTQEKADVELPMPHSKSAIIDLVALWTNHNNEEARAPRLPFVIPVLFNLGVIVTTVVFLTGLVIQALTACVIIYFANKRDKNWDKDFPVRPVQVFVDRSRPYLDYPDITYPDFTSSDYFPKSPLKFRKKFPFPPLSSKLLSKLPSDILHTKFNKPFSTHLINKYSSQFPIKPVHFIKQPPTQSMPCLTCTPSPMYYPGHFPRVTPKVITNYHVIQHMRPSVNSGIQTVPARMRLNNMANSGSFSSPPSSAVGDNRSRTRTTPQPTNIMSTQNMSQDSSNSEMKPSSRPSNNNLVQNTIQSSSIEDNNVSDLTAPSYDDYSDQIFFSDTGPGSRPLIRPTFNMFPSQFNNPRIRPAKPKPSKTMHVTFQNNSNKTEMKPNPSNNMPGQNMAQNISNSNNPRLRPRPSSNMPGQTMLQSTSNFNNPGMRPRPPSQSRPQSTSNSNNPGTRPRPSSNVPGQNMPQSTSNSNNPGMRPRPSSNVPGQNMPQSTSNSNNPGMRPRPSSNVPGQNMPQSTSNSNNPGTRPRPSSTVPGQNMPQSISNSNNPGTRPTPSSNMPGQSMPQSTSNSNNPDMRPRPPRNVSGGKT